jgi:predicted O-methyltransferase YrrM
MTSNIDRVAAAMKEQPWGITEEQGRILYEFILREKPELILELGCGIGTSACYMAAALAELGRGTITSVDKNPDLYEWVARTFGKVNPDFGKHHELIISATSYNDELLKIIEARSGNNICLPLYDFCFIDGAHTWEVDGFAFFLCEKLLKPGKWILFDDLSWTIASSVEAQKHCATQLIPKELQRTPQVMKVFKFLVGQHAGFEDITIAGDWGWARKKAESERSSDVVDPIVNLYRKPNIVVRVFRRLQRLIHRRTETAAGSWHSMIARTFISRR